MNIKIELPATFGIVSRNAGVEADLSKLSAEIIAKLALHGLTQKVADSAAGAVKDAGFDGRKYADLTKDEKSKVDEVAKESMGAVLEALVAGNWSERRAGGNGLDEVERKMLVLFGEFIRAEAKAVWAENFKPLEGAERTEKLLAFMRGQDEVFVATLREKAEAAIEAERKAKSGLGKLKLDVKL